MVYHGGIIGISWEHYVTTPAARWMLRAERAFWRQVEKKELKMYDAYVLDIRAVVARTHMILGKL